VATGAFETVAARNSRLDGYAVAGFEVLYVGAGPDDFAGAFVAQTVWCLDFEISDAAGVPEVDVGAGRRWCEKFDSEQNISIGPAICLPANAITSHVDNAFIRLGIQLWRLAHVDLMSFVREQSRIRLRWLELGHDR
jgi:hypothetical protein